MASPIAAGEGPVAVLADVHGNTPAFTSVIEDVISQGCTACFVLGDIINGVDPQGAIDLLTRLPGARCVKGNAELYLVTPDLGRAGELYPQPGVREVVALVMWIRSRLSVASMDVIRAMPDVIADGRRWYLHDTPADRLRLDGWKIDGVLPEHQELMHHSPGFDPGGADRERRRLYRLMKRHRITELYMGHTHMPFVLRSPAGLVCNAGSVGMPLDGDRRASWLLVESPGDTPSSTRSRPKAFIRRVSYDLDATFEIVDRVAHEYPDFRSAADIERYKRRLWLATFE